MKWEIKEVETRVLTREEAVAEIGEEEVAKLERNAWLGINKPYVRTYRVGSLLARTAWVIRSIIYNIKKLF